MHSLNSRYIYWLTICLTMLTITSCSTQKNTWASRSFHQTKVKYNIYYNGNVAYEEGLQAINSANEDDYSTMLNLYPVSNHQAAQAAASQMDKTIEKCRKCIKLHSIKAKPKPNPKKRSDPQYKLWLQQEEFNNQMGNAWIRLGEAEFHKGDFLGAVGTFTYISKHYQHDADMIARCQLWIARSYAELGWLYEAEDMLSKVQVDALSKKHAPLYSAVSADVLLKNNRFHDAIPFVKIALPSEKRKIYRPRFWFVLAQLYEREGNKSAAEDAYNHVIRLTPAPTMDFNARLRRAQLSGKSAVKSLQKMAKLSKHKDQLDQIYGAIANIYMSASDTTQALKYFDLAIEKSTTPAMPKAAVLVQAADIYFDRRDYVKAQPLYREASTILSVDHADYERVESRTRVLDELIVEYTMLQLQDSLQRLSRMSEQEQRDVIDKLIADLIQAEKEAQEKAAQQERENTNKGPLGVNTQNMLGGAGQSADWYFYNAQLLRSGKQDFARKWGSRPLEDNWRRMSKSSAPIFNMPSDAEDSTDEQSDESTGSDESTTSAPVTDNHQPEFYLQQIPRTPEDLAASDSLIARALYNMVYIYKDLLHDDALADATLDELARRFPSDSHLIDLYYRKYLDAIRTENESNQVRYRQLIISTFPNSTEAKIVAEPDYFDRLRRMAKEQDSLYDATYQAYTQSHFADVKQNKAYAEQYYPLSPLMPRFLFLNAIAVAKTEGQDAFVDQLRDMVNRYPESELGAKAKDMLAMMGQGMESQKTTSTSSLADLRGQSTEPQDSVAKDVTFSIERKAPSYVLIVLPEGSQDQLLNELLYQVALFNFSQFLVRDFDLQKLPALGNTSALRIAGMDSMDEAEWYMGLMSENADLSAFLRTENTTILPITEDNFSLLNTHFTLDDYRQFLQQ